LLSIALEGSFSGILLARLLSLFLRFISSFFLSKENLVPTLPYWAGSGIRREAGRENAKVKIQKAKYISYCRSGFSFGRVGIRVKDSTSSTG
jgi:hypothetical protein